MTGSHSDEDWAQELEQELEQELLRPVTTDLVQEGTTRQAPVSTPALTEPHSLSHRCRPGAGLLQLPEELLGKVLQFLSPEDLTVTAQTCRVLKSIASSETVWQRFHAFRWGAPDEETEQISSDSQASWKTRYMDRDTVEGEESCANASGFEETIYRQIAVSRRAQPLTRAQLSEAAQQAQPDSMAGSVSKWRSARGLQGASKDVRGSRHACSGKPTFSRLGTKTFLCDTCGWQHVCDNNCTERVVQRDYELPVCPISGRCFEHMLNEWEQPEVRGDADDQAEENPEYFSLSGRLGLAFSAGYNCSSRAELRRRCGVVL